MPRLQGIGALVTGGGNGIGRAAALAMVDEGASIAVLDIDEDAAQRVTDEILEKGGVAVSCTADVAKEQSLARAVEKARQRLGRISVLFNAAGIVGPALLTDMTLESFEQVVRVNLTGTFLTLRVMVPLWMDEGGGKYIGVASPAGVRGQVGGANYAAAKAGVIALIKTAAVELARHGITANALLPIAATDMSAKVRSDPALAKEFLSLIPLRRWASADEIAPSVVFLASSESDYMTGSILTIDGGRTI